MITSSSDIIFYCSIATSFTTENLFVTITNYWKSVLIIRPVVWQGTFFYASSQMQQMYQDASAQGTEGVLLERLKVQFENSIIKQLSLKVGGLINCHN